MEAIVERIVEKCIQSELIEESQRDWMAYSLQRKFIRKIHPHMFRHTFVSILLSNPDIGVATVAAEAGHAQPSTTLAIYTQVYHKRQDSIRSQMSETLYKRKTPER